MPPTPVRDLVVGIFVLAGLAAIGYLSISLGGLSYAGPGGLHLVATFDEIGDLRPRAQVVISGVKVGTVESIRLDPDFRAEVTLEVNSELELTDETNAAIETSGLLGDQYISLDPGGGDRTLKDGDRIAYTQSAIVIQRLIGRVVQNFGGDDGG